MTGYSCSVLGELLSFPYSILYQDRTGVQYRARGNELSVTFFKHRILGNLILPFLLVWIVNRIVSGNISMSLLDELIELLMHGETTLPYSWYVFSILLFYILFYMIAAKRNVVIISFLCVFTYIVLTVSLSYERCWYISCVSIPIRNILL